MARARAPRVAMARAAMVAAAMVTGVLRRVDRLLPTATGASLTGCTAIGRSAGVLAKPRSSVTTARAVRDMLPGAHFATVYAKPKGREMVDTFITEVSQDTWIFFPWDLDVAYVAPISGDTE